MGCASPTRPNVRTTSYMSHMTSYFLRHQQDHMDMGTWTWRTWGHGGHGHGHGHARHMHWLMMCSRDIRCDRTAHDHLATCQCDLICIWWRARPCMEDWTQRCMRPLEPIVHLTFYILHHGGAVRRGALRVVCKMKGVRMCIARPRCVVRV